MTAHFRMKAALASRVDQFVPGWLGITALVAVGAALLPSAACAAHGWSAPRTAATGKVSLIGLAVAPNGRAALAWQDPTGLEVAIGRPAVFARSERVSGQPVAQRLVKRDRAQLAIANTGATALVWQSTPLRGSTDSSAIWVAFRPAGKAWEPPQRLAEDAFWPQVGFDAAGNATITWWSHGIIQAIERQTGDSWGVPVDIATGGSAPRLAVSGEGRAAIVWNGGGVGVALREAPAAGFGPPQTVAGPSTGPADRYSGAQVRLDTTGRAVVTWLHNDVVETAAAAAGGLWSAAAVDQPAYAPFNGGATEAARASDAAGEEFAAWWAGTLDGSRSVVQVAGQPTGGTFAAPQTLAVSRVGHGLSRPPALAVSAAGGAVVVWQQQIGARVVTRAASRRVGAPHFGPPAAIESQPGRLAYNQFQIGVPQIAVDRAGVAVAAWQTCGAVSRCTIRTSSMTVR